jgi:hypothetical protein
MDGVLDAEDTEELEMISSGGVENLVKESPGSMMPIRYV